MFELPHWRIGREDAQDVEAESGGELESWQDQHRVQQTAVFVQPALLVGLNAVEPRQQFELLDLLGHGPVTGHRVVVGEGDDIQSTRFGLAQNIKVADFRFLVIGRTGRV